MIALVQLFDDVSDLLDRASFYASLIVVGDILMK